MRKKLKLSHSILKDGSVSVTGFKHLLVGIMCAAVALPQKKIILENVPAILETEVLSKLIVHLGGQAEYQKNSLTLSTQHLSYGEIPNDLSALAHGSIYLLPVLLGRFGKIKIGQTGGCQIGGQDLQGGRPIAHMIDILTRFGGRFHTGEEGVLEAESDGFLAQEIDIMDYSDQADLLTGPRVSGATKTVILAAMSVQKGITRIKNPYLKPDVTELLHFLEQSGYQIVWEGKTLVSIEGPKTLDTSTVVFRLYPDVSQVMTYLTLALYCNLHLTIQNIHPDLPLNGMQAEFELLKKMGLRYEILGNALIIPAHQKLTAVDIEVTSVSIYSDHQPFFALLLTLADQAATIQEYVWASRFAYAKELQKLGFEFDLRENCLRVFPSFVTRGADLYASDLRAAAVLLLAALKCKEVVHLQGVEHLERGYDQLVPELQRLGADIEYVD